MFWSGGRIIANNGSKTIVTMIAPYPPIVTILIASIPLPSKTILWPGRIVKAVPSSGTPRNIDGINSIIACVIDMDTNKTHKDSGDVKLNKKVEDANIIAPAVFTWIPGIKPVVVPQIIPRKQAIKKSKILSPLFSIKLNNRKYCINTNYKYFII
jgi:hypothetical protein